MKKPSVVILCPKEFKFTDHEASVESPFLADVATVSTQVCFDECGSIAPMLTNALLNVLFQLASHIVCEWHA